MTPLHSINSDLPNGQFWFCSASESLSVAVPVFPAGGTDLLGGALTSHVSTIQ